MVIIMKDFYTDFGHNFIKIFQNREVPSFAKEAETLDSEYLQSLPDSAFADSDSRSLPLTDAGNVYVSAAYYYGANEKSASVEERIVKAAQLFNISKEVEELAADLSEENSKTAAVVYQDWAITVTGVDNITRVFDGCSGESLKKFAKYFVNDLFGTFDFSQKVSCAKQIADKMASYDIEIPERILQVAGLNIPNTEKVAQEIKARAVRIHDNSEKVALCKIADDLIESDDKDINGMFKVAQLLEIFDKKHSLARHYGKSIQDPFASVFNTPRAEAEKLASVVDLGGDSYSYEELSEIPQGVLKLALSEESAKLVGVGTDEYNPSKLASLSEDERTRLSSYL